MNSQNTAPLFTLQRPSSSGVSRCWVSRGAFYAHMEIDPSLLSKLLAIKMRPSATVQVIQILLDYEPSQTARNTADALRKRAYREKRGIKASEWERLRQVVFERDGYTCTYCGSDGGGRSLHCDHVLAVANGGSNEMENFLDTDQRRIYQHKLLLIFERDDETRSGTSSWHYCHATASQRAEAFGITLKLWNQDS